jgi:hypothetical protein
MWSQKIHVNPNSTIVGGFLKKKNLNNAKSKHSIPLKSYFNISDLVVTAVVVWQKNFSQT